MRRRHKNKTWAYGLLCWGMLAAVCSATAVSALLPVGAKYDSGAEIVRAPLPDSAVWRPRPMTASAAGLFFAHGKGPRADVDTESITNSRIELASVDTESAASALTGHAGMAAGLVSLRDPGQRETEAKCLAEVIYFEGRGQPRQAQSAVGQTVINRALSGAYPRSLCGVAHQRGSASNQCQYQFACNDLAGAAKDRLDWTLAQETAGRLLDGSVWLADIGDATHLHPIAEHPPWARYLQRVKRIGALVFYRGDFASPGKGAPALAN